MGRGAEGGGGVGSACNLLKVRSQAFGMRKERKGGVREGWGRGADLRVRPMAVCPCACNICTNVNPHCIRAPYFTH